MGKEPNLFENGQQPNPEKPEPGKTGAKQVPPKVGGENAPGNQSPQPPGLETDYKKKFSESTAEAQRLTKQLEEERKAKEKVETELAQAREATVDVELSKQYGDDWELMDDRERNLARENLKMKRDREQEEARRRREEERGRFDKDFNQLVQEDEFKVLADEKDSFRIFCEENPGASMKALAKSFLFDRAKELGAKDAAEKAEREGLESSTYGPNAEPGAANEPSEEELSALRTTNPAQYQKIIQARAKKRQEQALSR